MANLTKEELEKVQGLVNDFNSLKIQLGDTVISQQALLRKVEELRIAYAQEEAVLIEKYGQDSVINVQTGEVTESIPAEQKE